jgi:hypothetical protein
LDNHWHGVRLSMFWRLPISDRTATRRRRRAWAGVGKHSYRIARCETSICRSTHVPELLYYLSPCTVAAGCSLLWIFPVRGWNFRSNKFWPCWSGTMFSQGTNQNWQKLVEFTLDEAKPLSSAKLPLHARPQTARRPDRAPL